MKYYCEETNTIYDTLEECKKVEEEIKKKRAEEAARKEKLTKERAERAKEVEMAQEEAIEAIQNYKALLHEFCEDYGSFHMTLDNDDLSFKDLVGVLRNFF